MISAPQCEHRHGLGKERLSTKSVEAGGRERQVRTVGTHSSCCEPASASPSIECLGLGVTQSGMNLAMTVTLTWNWASYVISPSFRYLTCRTGMAIASNADELISRPLILLVSLLSNQWMRFIYISFKILWDMWGRGYHPPNSEGLPILLMVLQIALNFMTASFSCWFLLNT